MKQKNTVATILHIYAIINFIACFVICLIILDNYDEILFAVGMAISIVINFGIYAFGEVISLLHQIKCNTACGTVENGSNTKSVFRRYDDIPEL